MTILVFSLAGLGSLRLHAQTLPRPRIRQAIDESRRVVLKGHVHPLAQGRFDRGAAPEDLPMERMWLVLIRGEEQQEELDGLLEELHDPLSPNYGLWLTPEEFGRRVRIGVIMGGPAPYTAYVVIQNPGGLYASARFDVTADRTFGRIAPDGNSRTTVPVVPEVSRLTSYLPERTVTRVEVNAMSKLRILWAIGLVCVSAPAGEGTSVPRLPRR